MPTEKTPLTAPSTSFGSTPPPVPFYVQDTHRFYSRRRRERQIQCIMFVTIIATFILALVVTISYSVNHPDLLPPVTNVSSSEEAATPPRGTLQATGQGKKVNVGGVSPKKSTDEAVKKPKEDAPKKPKEDAPKKPKEEALKKPKERAGEGREVLSVEEVKEALQAGNEAIAARRLADAAARPLPKPSAIWRHQFAVSTSPRANEIALAGLAELAATRRIEQARSFMGRPSSFGAFLDGGWPGLELPDLCTQRLDIRCPLYAAKYRRFNGACNQAEQRGMAYSPYRRVLPPDYADGIGAPRLGKFGQPLPSAREVSLKVHPPSPSTNPSFTVMLAVFGQFLDHDITATAASRGVNGSSLSCCPDAATDEASMVPAHPECFPVQVGPGDPVFDLAGSSCMEFVRSAPAAQCKIGPRQQLNQVTAFIDGSAIYGSELETAEGLREFAGGRLRMQLTPDQRTLLPASTNPEDGCNRELELARGRYCFATGDARANENLHLTTMHLLWARQHNLLAERLAAINPQWDDERLYQESRRIVGAQLQHVAYREFLPIVLGESEVARRQLRPLASGFRTAADQPPDPSIANHFAAAAFRFAHTLLPGLMKVTDKQKATTSYVLLHKMLFNPYSLYSQGGVESSITSATSNAIQKTTTHVSAQLTEHLFEDPLANQSSSAVGPSVPCGLDLVSLNIQRGRDHGLPGYVKWRQFCGLSVPSTFDDLTADMDPEALAAISKLYDSVDDVDLYTGALAEINHNDGLVGPTFTCLIADQFERLQAGDRYWYETAAQPGSFTEEQLQEIRKTTMARIICDTSDGITEVQAEVMRSIGPDNPMMSCEDIARVELQAWKSEIPLLAVGETVVPAFDWLKFKGDVNKTLGDIIASIAAKKPPVGSLPEDWLTFQNAINGTFSDLRNKFATLHPKVVTNVSLTGENELTDGAASPFDWMGLKDDVSATVSEIMDSIIANKPAPGSLPADWLAYRKKINDSLLDVTKKFKVIHPKPVLTKAPAAESVLGEIPAIDWLTIKNQINSTIMDVVTALNSTKPLPGSPPADWFAFRKKINDSLIGIKAKFAKLHPKPLSPLLKLDEALDDPAFDWLQFKDQLNITFHNIVAFTASKKPPPDATPAEWLEFQQKLSTSLAKLVDQFSQIKSQDAAAAVADNKTDEVVVDPNVNKTITEIVAEINASKPAPGAPQADWLAFQKKMNDAFASAASKYAGGAYKTKSKPKLKKALAPSDPSFDMAAFKDDLNKTLNGLVDLIKTKRPEVNSSVADWLAYKKEVKASVSKLKKDIAMFKTKDVVVATEFATGPVSIFDWMGLKNQINSTIDKILIDIQTIPPGDPKWATFRDYLNGTFSALRDKIATPASAQEKLMGIMQKDLLDFQDKVNSTIEDALDDMAANEPVPPGDAAKKKKKTKTKAATVVNQLAEMQENLKALQIEWLERAKAATDMIILTDVRLMATVASSSSAIHATPFTFNFCAIIIVFRIRSAL